MSDSRKYWEWVGKGRFFVGHNCMEQWWLQPVIKSRSWNSCPAHHSRSSRLQPHRNIFSSHSGRVKGSALLVDKGPLSFNLCKMSRMPGFPLNRWWRRSGEASSIEEETITCMESKGERGRWLRSTASRCKGGCLAVRYGIFLCPASKGIHCFKRRREHLNHTSQISLQNNITFIDEIFHSLTIAHKNNQWGPKLIDPLRTGFRFMLETKVKKMRPQADPN